MLRARRSSLCAVAAVLLASAVAGCGSAGTRDTDRQAGVLAEAISYPRQHDAAGFARAALATSLGRSGHLAILEASDLHQDSYADPGARLVIRIHVPAHEASGFGDESSRAIDACYRVEYLLPSSALAGDPRRLDCPADAVPITPPPPTQQVVPAQR
jgi:hypothetical protein